MEEEAKVSALESTSNELLIKLKQLKKDGTIPIDDYIIDNLKIGGAGVISATTNFSGSLAKKVYDDFKKTGSSNEDEKLKNIRSAFDESGNLITALHTLKSIENKAYANLLPPLELLNENKKDELIKKLKELGVPSEKEYMDMYCENTGKDLSKNWEFYMAFNMFKIAGILQGILGRVRDGTASSKHAEDRGMMVYPLSKAAWDIIEENL